jgi:adenosylcobinamide-phosphate synthase
MTFTGRAIRASAAESGRMQVMTVHPLNQTQPVPVGTRWAPLSARAAGIALGVLADAVFGDPRRGHPVAGFGRWAGALERALYQPSRVRGAGHLLVTTAAPVLLGLAAERATARRPIGRVIVVAAGTWAALGGTSLARQGLVMAEALERGDLDAARAGLSHLCARDPAGLDAADLTRATVESLAENTSDAVVAPLLWAAVAGAPGVLGYRAINTLDAMVGYRSARYREFGWAAARLDDVVNLVPARVTGMLTVAAAPLVRGSAAGAWRVWRQDARRHPSPNAGHCEAAAAGALGVRLGGTNQYHGQVESRPVLGASGRVPDVADVRRAARLGRLVGLGSAVLAVIAAAKAGGRRCAGR